LPQRPGDLFVHQVFFILSERHFNQKRKWLFCKMITRLKPKAYKMEGNRSSKVEYTMLPAIHPLLSAFGKTNFEF